MKAAIRHMVVFNLKYPKDSPQARAFIQHARETFAKIPVAQNVMQCYEVSPKNNYDYGFSFDFMHPQDYETYNLHPLHVQFVKEHWESEVTDFLEVDFQEI